MGWKLEIKDDNESEEEEVKVPAAEPINSVMNRSA